eukprot:6205708-Pleurochrysis_carterae.AAC.2
MSCSWQCGCFRDRVHARKCFCAYAVDLRGCFAGVCVRSCSCARVLRVACTSARVHLPMRILCVRARVYVRVYMGACVRARACVRVCVHLHVFVRCNGRALVIVHLLSRVRACARMRAWARVTAFASEPASSRWCTRVRANEDARVRACGCSFRRACFSHCARVHTHMCLRGVKTSAGMYFVCLEM